MLASSTSLRAPVCMKGLVFFLATVACGLPPRQEGNSVQCIAP